MANSHLSHSLLFLLPIHMKVSKMWLTEYTCWYLWKQELQLHIFQYNVTNETDIISSSAHVSTYTGPIQRKDKDYCWLFFLLLYSSATTQGITKLMRFLSLWLPSHCSGSHNLTSGNDHDWTHLICSNQHGNPAWCTMTPLDQSVTGAAADRGGEVSWGKLQRQQVVHTGTHQPLDFWPHLRLLDLHSGTAQQIHCLPFRHVVNYLLYTLQFLSSRKIICSNDPNHIPITRLLCSCLPENSG